MSSVATWPSQAENWLDERGKGAWIAAMVLGFIFIWPVGLAILFYMIWSKRMHSSRSCGKTRRHSHRSNGHSFRSTGNTAFDSYKSETLKRLEDEQDAFHSFLNRLREAKDKTEFDQFMDDRAENAKPASDETDEV
ncbi:MAG: hypothetical protein ACI9ZD_000247 [Paracoccaceae bacterium]|jgi:hypothetical protein